MYTSCHNVNPQNIFQTDIQTQNTDSKNIYYFPFSVTKQFRKHNVHVSEEERAEDRVTK